MTIKELDKIRESKKDLIAVRRLVKEEGEKLAKETGYRKQVLVCGGTGCTSSRSKEIIEVLETTLKNMGIKDVLVIKTGCETCSWPPEKTRIQPLSRWKFSGRREAASFFRGGG